MYIDDLGLVIPENVAVTMFAITNVAKWSRRRKLTLNASKCKVAFFTCNSKEARWQPSA